MVTLRIEHRIASYEGWKKAFDSDPVNRKQSGVKQYRIYRSGEENNYVIIDLDFDNPDQAQNVKEALMRIFPKIEGSLIFGVSMKVLNLVESVTL